MSANANTVILKGHVRFSDGVVAPGRTITVVVDTTGTTCRLSGNVGTDGNGQYYDSLVCAAGSGIRSIIISTQNCDGSILTKSLDIPAGRDTTIEYNFALSCPSCIGGYRDSISGSTGTFYSTGTAGTGDSITARVWDFGDTTAEIFGNLAQITHQFTYGGSHTVCMTIRTALGCSVGICNAVVTSAPPSPTCTSNFIDSIKTNAVTFYSTATSSDSIVSRVWSFGDTTANVTGNSATTTHTYANGGTHTACLAITSSKGCTNSVCKAVVTTLPPVTCTSNFTDSIKDATVIFSSTATSSDSIVSRVWSFGDTTANVTGNNTTTTHTYANSGTHNACLAITSSKGCTNTVCKNITVVKPVCVSNFTDSIRDGSVTFLSTATAPAGDTIVSRTWNFGDSTTAPAVLGGNNTSAAYRYSHNGTYTACLNIATSKGCTSSSCKPVAISSSVLNCVSNFTDTLFGVNANLNSTATIAAGDTITSRLWTFGDNTAPQAGNHPGITHEYPGTGAYNTCLAIVTAKGCMNTTCKTVPVTASIPCKSNFTDTIKGSTVVFVSAATATDSIISRTWNFGDTINTSTLPGNLLAPSHQYAKAGSYTACLTIATSKGCNSQVCKVVNITPANAPSCISVFADSISGPTVTFISRAQSNDSIISRTWDFGDTTATAGGNLLNVTHQYAKAGTHTACLVIKTAHGCSSQVCNAVTTGNPPSAAIPNCKLEFSDSIRANYVSFYSHIPATAAANDSVTSRTWTFGDSSATLTGNTASPAHQYAGPGTYAVCVAFKTASGCSGKACGTVTIVPPAPAAPPPACNAGFTSTLVGDTASFTAVDYVSPNDSIVSRAWGFGNGAAPITNQANPSVIFTQPGMYTVCTKIKTARGCESGFCETFIISDTSHQNSSSDVKIISISPNPVSSQTTVVIFSKNNNVDAELDIFDVYGTKRWTGKKTLLQGNNSTVISTSFLASGLYYFRVTSSYGVQSLPLYKF